jgi:hypothetical protein
MDYPPIFMHSCGKVEEVIDDFIEARIEVLNPIQPECNDLYGIYRNIKTNSHSGEVKESNQ